MKKQPKKTIMSSIVEPIQMRVKVQPHVSAKTKAQLKLAPKDVFMHLKVGTPTNEYGERELKVVDDNFVERNQTQKRKLSESTRGKTTELNEEITVSVNTRQFGEFNSTEAGLSPQWLLPGVLMTAQSFISGTCAMENKYARGPIRLSTSLVGADDVVEDVETPHQRSRIVSAVNRLRIANKTAKGGGSIQYKHLEFHSEEELGFKLTGKFQGNLGLIKSKANIGSSMNSRREKHYYAIEFTHHMFDITADDINPDELFLEANDVLVQDYVYVSQVVYGRRGLIIFSTNESLKTLGISVGANFDKLLVKGEVNTVYNSLVNNKDVEISAYFYGGDPKGALKSLEETIQNRKPNLFDFISTGISDYDYAVPIGYRLKNLRYENLGMSSKFKQHITTTTVREDVELRVTLTDLQCINGRDGKGNPDDYGLQLYVIYKALGKEKVHTSRRIRKFEKEINGNYQVSNVKNPLIRGDMKNQIHVNENADARNRNRNQINNSIVFTITPEELRDNHSSFEFYVWVKEYTSSTLRGNSDKVLANNLCFPVKINDVVKILQNKMELKPTTSHPDKTIGKNIRFHNFGGGYLLLADIQELENRVVLEGPIRVGEPGMKAAVWVQFELV